MDSEKVSEGGNDTRGIYGSDECNYKLELLGKHLKVLDKNILSTRNCWDYILNEIKVANEKIVKDIAWNQKRLDLLKDISDKLCIYEDEKQECFNEFFSLITLANNVNKINLNK